jgi:hypothetical protein
LSEAWKPNGAIYCPSGRTEIKLDLLVEEPAMILDVPLPIQRMIDATNSADRAAFLECFTPDAFLNDWGSKYRGRDEIARWNETDNIGKQSQMRILAIRKTGAVYESTIDVRGKGYNGEGKLAFRLAGDRIAELIIS